jgi:hypothetical protein
VVDDLRLAGGAIPQHHQVRSMVHALLGAQFLSRLPKLASGQDGKTVVLSQQTHSVGVALSVHLEDDIHLTTCHDS